MMKILLAIFSSMKYNIFLLQDLIKNWNMGFLFIFFIMLQTLSVVFFYCLISMVLDCLDLKFHILKEIYFKSFMVKDLVTISCLIFFFLVNLFIFSSFILSVLKVLSDLLIFFEYKGLFLFWMSFGVLTWWVVFEPKDGVFSNLIFSYISWEMGGGYYFGFSMLINIYLISFLWFTYYSKSLPQGFKDYFTLGLIVIFSIFMLIPMTQLTQGASPWSNPLMYVVYFLYILICTISIYIFNMNSNLIPVWFILSVSLVLSFLGVWFLDYSYHHVSYNMTSDKTTTLLFLWEAYNQSGGSIMGPSFPTKIFEQLFLDSDNNLPIFWLKDGDPKKELFMDMMWALSMEPKTCEDFAHFVESFMSSVGKLNVKVSSMF